MAVENAQQMDADSMQVIRRCIDPEPVEQLDKVDCVRALHLHSRCVYVYALHF